MRTRGNRARISIAVVIVFVVVIVFIVRLVDIQVVRAADLNAASEDRRAQTLVTYGTRGDIVDSSGAVLADSVLRYDITASPRVALGRSDAATSVLADLTRIAAITGQDPATMYASLSADPTSDFAYIIKSVTLDTYEKIDALDIPWLYASRHPARTYPNGQIAGNLVGFIGTDGPQAGLELSEDECLASTNGTATYESAEDGTQLPGSVVTTQETKDGGTLRLTIDRDLQWYVQQRMQVAAGDLGATWATAVVIRISDGHLMAVADWPTVDPNNVDDAPRDALGSRAFSTPYEPGSTIKALTAASLVDAGVATPESGVVVPYSLEQPDGSSIHDAFYHDTENLTLTGALVESSNVAVSQFSDLLPAQQRHDYMAAFGLGQETEVNFLGESSGDLPDADQWFGRSNYSVQYGQGISATSVQVASIFQTLGNGGVRMPVTLVEGCEHPDGTVTDKPSTEGRQVVSEAAARTTISMMEQVANKSGSAPNLQIPGYRTAVKSGTAEVAVNGEYGNQVIISYAGVAPADNPQYAVVVTAGNLDSVYSGLIAPVWRDVMAQTLTTFRVPPSTTPAPDLPVYW
ncbi:MAG: penicillin-binding protein 2 [Actinobacteria bacterium]|nr:penicillin-binding protein 2 [Actinomycetota bacterium]